MIEIDPLVNTCHLPETPINFGGYNERETPNERGEMCELTRNGYVDFTKKYLNGDTVPTFFIGIGSLSIDPEIHDQLNITLIRHSSFITMMQTLEYGSIT